VWPAFVVVHQPLVSSCLHLADRVEEPRVEHLLAEAAVEALDERVLIGLARLDVQQLDPVLLGRVGNRVGGQLRPIVHPDRKCTAKSP
jgi:hypothetical protein